VLIQWIAVAMEGMLIICSILSFAMSLRIAVLCCQYYFDCCARGDCSCCDLVRVSMTTVVLILTVSTQVRVLLLLLILLYFRRRVLLVHLYRCVVKGQQHPCYHRLISSLSRAIMEQAQVEDDDCMITV
jgi:hypothetical protein